MLSPGCRVLWPKYDYPCLFNTTLLHSQMRASGLKSCQYPLRIEIGGFVATVSALSVIGTPACSLYWMVDDVHEC